ncbi:hypothetical protein GJ633_08430 [Halorubrum sp. CBA1125]|uniref:hypothetical protein n=1 Tax=Halorubrum sp. CBA1125 TaxID=2668072 RepID=UPI0012E92AAB|nr:hypothetical protein [Halorubrum sp. CBA1125]MUW14686.1 hypothetical protein [Halorubrum sp. CBA1125]
MSDDGPGTREVAHRVFAAEFDDASLSYSESDEERAPNYVVTPTGARVNRLFVAGVLTEIERVNEETRRGRVVDPSGAFVTYAGQYQPDAQTFLERAEPPAFVALTGKARTFEPEDSDRVFTSVRPESLNDVDADTRDRWVVAAAEATLDRLAVFALALASDRRGEELRAALEVGGAPASLAAGIPTAIEHYDTSTAYVEAVRRLAVDALELVAGDRDEVRAPEFAPDGGGDAAIGPLPETDVTIASPPESAVEDAEGAESAERDVRHEGDETPAESTAASEPEATAETETASEPEATTAEPGDDTAAGPAEADASADRADAGAAPETEAEPETGAAAETAGSADSGGLGDFDAGSGETGAAAESAADAGDADIDDADGTGDETAVDLDAEATDAETDDMYQLDDAEREEIEAEYGTDFSTGTEVDEPGEADIDVPDADDLTEESAADPEATTDDAVASEGDETGAEADDADEGEAGGDGEAAADVDLEAAVVDAMTALDDGEGADREAVVEAVVDEYGADADAVEDAIQDALMSGKCYEPGDGVLKPI